MKKTIYKKIIVIMVLIGFILPQPSYAIFGVGDEVTDPVTNAQEIMNIIKEYGLDTLASLLLNIMTQKIANKVFNKANGGASGDSSQPSYIENFSSFFSDLKMGQVDKFITDLGTSKNPFATTLSQSLVKSVQGGAGGINDFNLDTVVGKNWKDFANNSDVGGWGAYLALSNPANTNIGSSLLAKQELGNSIAQKEKEEITKLTVPGTKPQGKCNLDFGEYKNQIENSIRGKNQSGSGGGHSADDSGDSPRSAGDGPRSSDPDEHGGDRVAGTGTTNPRATGSTSSSSTSNQSASNEAAATNAASQSNQNATNQAASGTKSKTGGFDVSGLTEDYGGCLDELINNPLQFVGSTITSSLDSTAANLSSGDEIGEVITGALMQMTSTFLKAGLSSLSADFKSNKDSIGGPEQLIAKNGQNIPWTQTPGVIIDMPAEFQQSIDSTEKEVANLRKYTEQVASVDDRGSFASAITDLDQCIPGPDYGFRKRLNAYVSKQTKKLGKRKDKGSSKASKYKPQRKNNAWDNIETSVDSAKIYTELAEATPARNIPGSGMMLTNVASITQVQQKYSESRTELVKKQIALSLLYSVENSLQANMQTLKPVLPTLPAVVPFTTQRWDKMATEADRTANRLSAEQRTVLAWAKNITFKIPATVTGITSNDIPITTADWNALTAAQKKAAVAWAESVTEKLDEVSDKDFVLGTVWYYTGVDETPETSPNDTKRDLVIKTVWKVWTNPENYMATAWDPEGDDANRFLRGKGGKNEIRTTYNGLQTSISIPYSAQKSESDLKELASIIQETKDLVDDCNNLRTLANENRALAADVDGHKKFITILQQRINTFKSPNMRDSIKYPENSILGQPNAYPDHTDCDADGCYDGSDLVAPTYGADEDADDEPTIPDRILKMFQKYQVKPAKNIWELLDQGNKAFCGFNGFLVMYPNESAYLPNTVLDGGKPIACDSEWTDIERTDIRAIIFANNEDKAL